MASHRSSIPVYVGRMRDADLRDEVERWLRAQLPAAWVARLGEPGQARVANEELNRYRVPRSFNLIGIGMGGPTCGALSLSAAC